MLAAVAALADRRLRATPEQLSDALGAATDRHPVYRRLLHQGVRYEERGPAVSRARTQRRAATMVCVLRSLGYRVELFPTAPGSPA